MSRFYITTAIDYVNSRPHLGTAYEKISADVIARYKRLSGVETRFLMGNDEHSQNVFRRARELGTDPLTYCDRMEQEFRQVWQKLNISFDDFIRTSQPRHHAAVKEFVRRSAEAGDIYEGFYEGWYCVSCEAFKQEKDLVDGACSIHQRPAEWIREKNYFFRLSRYQARIQQHFDDHPDFLQPDIRRNEILRLLESGLEDISVSRAGQAWGIPMPVDPGSVVYVWYDALINYVSALGFPDDKALYEHWWPADLHVIGKDITRFHCVVWPAMLMSAGLPLPKQVFGHGWVHLKGQKMSKSLGTALDPLEAADRFGPDPLRLYLIKEIPYGGDGDFSWERFEERYNVDLANNLGNLVSRVAAMTDRYQGGKLRPVSGGSGRLAAVASEAVTDYRRAMDQFALHEATAAAYRIVDSANEFIAETEPWTIARDGSQADRLNQVLYEAAEAVRIAALLLSPTMPDSSTEILRRFGETRLLAELKLDDAAWRVGEDRKILKADALWPRLGAPEPTAGARLESQTERKIVVSDPSPERAADQPPAEPVAPNTTPAPIEPAQVSIDEFMKIELRVAKVLAAERVPNSRKLIKLQVSLGTEERTVVAGIADAYEPEALVGRSVVIVANLKPAKLMGIESKGMVLAASPEGGKAILLAPDQAPPPGTRVR